jgi:hypothetical protein
MNCEQVRTELLPLAFDGLEDGTETQLRIHLSGCVQCQTLEKELEDALSLLDQPETKAPSSAWDKIQNRIHEDLAKHIGDAKISIAVSCVYCKDKLGRAEAVFCGSCLAPHHPECFEEHGRCSNLGCAETRTVKPLDLPGPRFTEAAPAPKHDLKQPKRSRAMHIGMLTIGAGFAFGIAALTIPGEFVSHDATNDTAVAVEVKQPALARPILKAPRSVYRQVLDSRVTQVNFDRDGEPWFGAVQAGADFKKSFADAYERKLNNKGDLVLSGGYLLQQRADGILIAAPFKATTPREAQRTSPPRYAFMSGKVQLTENYREEPRAQSTIDPKARAPGNEKYLGADRYGRIYGLLSGAGVQRSIVVYDPWAEGRYPSSLVSSKEFKKAAKEALIWGARQKTLLSRKRLDPIPNFKALLIISKQLLGIEEKRLIIKAERWDKVLLHKVSKNVILVYDKQGDRLMSLEESGKGEFFDMTLLNLIRTKKGAAEFSLAPVLKWSQVLSKGAVQFGQGPVIADGQLYLQQRSGQFLVISLPPRVH